jgi:hypothetical protein
MYRLKIFVCFVSSIRQTSAVRRESNMASFYIHVKACLVNREIAREATEEIKTGTVELS